MTPAEIKKTRLYRTLAPKIRKQDREEFARMLALVSERSIVGVWTGMYGDNLGDAFDWQYSPQGWGYWEDLTRRLYRYDAGPAHQLPEDFQP